MSHEPVVTSQIGGKGITFTNFFVPNTLCCPSRTSILTGNYSHTTDVYANNAPNGGFVTFHDRGEEASTVATWLHSAGYRTGLIGKYLNSYGTAPGTDPAYIPPGWDQWDAFLLQGTPSAPEGKGGYFDTAWNQDGAVIQYGGDPQDYTTDVASNLAASFIHSVPAGRPLFLWLAPRAPHAPATPPPRYGSCTDARNPTIPSFNVVTPGQPAYLRALQPQAPKSLITQRNNRCGTLKAVDDMVANTLQALSDTGRLSNTLIVYMSDNGYELGEHRWDGKVVPYNESTRVPFMARWDGHIAPGSSTDAIGLNVDLAQTFADAAGAPAAPNDGRSLLPIMEGRTPRGWWTDYLLEHWAARVTVPDYCGVRSLAWLYVKYQTGEQELYNEVRDPYEIKNLADRPAFAARLAAMHTRLVTLCSPPPPGYTP